MGQQSDVMSVKKDLSEDADVLAYLVRDVRHRLGRRFRVSDGIARELGRVCEALSYELSEFRRDVRMLGEGSDITKLLQRKRHITEMLHGAIGVCASGAMSNQWQSPAIDQSVVDMAGPFARRIVAHFNDYTRDQHIDGVRFEQQYQKAYLPAGRLVRTYAYATVSGMAALTTAALFVLGETDPSASVLMGASCYFETKQLLHGIFGSRLHEVDLSKSKETAEAVRTFSPVAVFADTIGNEPDMRVVDIPPLVRIMQRVSSHKKKYVVVDTSASAYMRPILPAVPHFSGVTVIGVESLNKLLQFGLDRVTAGMVWGTGFDAMKLYDYRDHGGTMCPDVTIGSIPVPDKNVSTLYIRRLERNAGLLASHVKKYSKTYTHPVRVIYPDVAGFRGVYFMMHWKQSPFRSFDGFIAKVMRRAKREGVPLVYGTSFGLQTTRLYTVAMHTAYERPFLRVSPGTETEPEIETIGELLVAALQ